MKIPSVLMVATCLCPSASVRAENAATPLAIQGKALYAQHCSHCHGFNMVNPGTVTYDLRQFPREQKDRFVHSVIYGKDGIMPPWGDAMNLDDIDALWAYVLTGGHP
jgi:mono/diheme cytochrome c family protein